MMMHHYSHLRPIRIRRCVRACEGVRVYCVAVIILPIVVLDEPFNILIDRSGFVPFSTDILLFFFLVLPTRQYTADKGLSTRLAS